VRGCSPHSAQSLRPSRVARQRTQKPRQETFSRKARLLESLRKLGFRSSAQPPRVPTAQPCQPHRGLDCISCERYQLYRWRDRRCRLEFLCRSSEPIEYRAPTPVRTQLGNSSFRPPIGTTLGCDFVEGKLLSHPADGSARRKGQSRLARQPPTQTISPAQG